MEQLKSKLFSLLLFLVSIYVFLLIGEKLQLNLLFFAFLHSLQPFIIAIVLVFFIQPLIQRFPGHRYKLKTCIVYGLIGFSAVMLVGLISAYVYAERNPLISFTNQLYREGKYFVEKNQLEQFINLAQTRQLVRDTSQWFMNRITRFVGGLSVFFFGFVIAFFISMEMEFLMNEFKKYIKNHQKWHLFYCLFSDVFFKYCYSTLLDTVYIILTTSLILSLFKTPSFLLLSVLLALLNLFPYIGAMIGTLLILIVHVLSGGNYVFLLFFVLLVSSQIESDLIHPLIYNKAMKIHPLFLFFSILLNDFLFGVMGVILSPIMAAFLQMGVKSYLTTLNLSGVGGWEDLK